jgi:hypothetical protein
MYDEKYDSWVIGSGIYHSIKALAGKAQENPKFFQPLFWYVKVLEQEQTAISRQLSNANQPITYSSAQK